MNILLLAYRYPKEDRNPIAILDLASYYRMRGSEVRTKYVRDAGAEDFEWASWVGLSVLSGDGKDPVRYAMDVCVVYGKRVVIGGKWVRTYQGNRDVSGVSFIEEDGEILVGGSTGDLTGHPPWDACDFDTLGSTQDSVMSSRGCPYRCNFCHNTEPSTRYFHPERTISNIALLRQRGIKNIMIVDDVFTLDLRNMQTIRKGIERKSREVGDTFRFFTHVGHVNEFMIREIQKWDPSWVEIGVESGDAGQLRRMGKTFTPEDAKISLRMLRDAGIKVHALFLAGYPGETVESLGNTRHFIDDVRDCLGYIHVSFYQPVVGTVGHAEAIERRPGFGGGSNNQEVSYIDPNITEAILRQAKRAFQG